MIRSIFFALFIYLVVLTTSGCSYLFTPLKSDGQMSDNFYKNKDKFTRLLEMGKEDLGHLGQYKGFDGKLRDNSLISETTNSKGEKSITFVSAERGEEYKKLFQDLGITKFSLPSENNQRYSINYTHYSDEGMLSSKCSVEEEKTYVWQEAEPPNLVFNLDWQRTKDEAGKPAEAYRKLEGNWYLHYQKYFDCTR